MKEQLDRAYSLLRSGQSAEAFAILESIIRENPENDDAWWLYANGNPDTNAKRNALNNVIRLSKNPERQNNAAIMLQALDRDPYSFDSPAPANNNARSLQANKGFGRFVLLGIGVLGILACLGCIAVYNFALSFGEMPTTFTDMGVLETGTVMEGTLLENDNHAYQLHLEEAQRIRVTIWGHEDDANVDGSPFPFLYDEAGQLVGVSTEATVDIVRLEQTVSETGDYILIVRPTLWVGTGDYRIELEIIE